MSLISPALRASSEFMIFDLDLNLTAWMSSGCAACEAGVRNLPLSGGQTPKDHNDQAKPFQWVADPDEIIAAVIRGHQALDSIHSHVRRFKMQARFFFCSRLSASKRPRLGRARGTVMKTTVDHALMRGLAADSDEAGQAFQYEAGYRFRYEAGQGSDLMSAT